MIFESFEAQAAFNRLSHREQQQLYVLGKERLEEMMRAAFQKPRGILDIDPTIDEFGIPRTVPTRPGQTAEATRQFDAFHAFLLNALLVREERRKSEAA